MGSCTGSSPTMSEATGTAGPRESLAAPEADAVVPIAPREEGPTPSPAATSSRALMIKERMESFPDWAFLEDGNFLILHSTKIRPNYIKEIAARLHVLLKVLEADFPFEGAQETLFVVRICKDQGQYRQYGGSGGTAGYWSPNEKEMVSYFDWMAREWSLRHTPSLLVHAYFAEALSPLTTHEWFSLGLSTYYAGCDLSQSGNLVPRKSPDFHPASRKAKEEGTFASLEEFLRYG